MDYERGSFRDRFFRIEIETEASAEYNKRRTLGRMEEELTSIEDEHADVTDGEVVFSQEAQMLEARRQAIENRRDIYALAPPKKRVSVVLFNKYRFTRFVK